MNTKRVWPYKKEGLAVEIEYEDDQCWACYAISKNLAAGSEEGDIHYITDGEVIREVEIIKKKDGMLICACDTIEEAEMLPSNTLN